MEKNHPFWVGPFHREYSYVCIHGESEPSSSMNLLLSVSDYGCDMINCQDSVMVTPLL